MSTSRRIVQLLEIGNPVSRAVELIGNSPVRTEGQRLIRVCKGEVAVCINTADIAATVIPHLVA